MDTYPGEHMNSTPEKQILIAGAILLSLGIANAVTTGSKISPVIEGGVVLLLLASLGTALFPGAGKPIAALLLLAVVTALFVELPPLLKTLGVQAS